MKIVPAIDILQGSCVRLTQGDFENVKIYHEDPVSVARGLQEAGFTYLHLVDLDGARKGKVVNWQIIQRIQSETNLFVDFGGGVRSEADVERLLDFRIGHINIGSLAVSDPERFKKWLEKYGAEKFILSADVKEDQLMISGWKEPSKLKLFDLVEQYAWLGLEHLTCTDVVRDGMMQGPNLELYKKLTARFPRLHITASGGISSMDDLQNLKSIAVERAIIGKAFYERKISVEDLLTI